MTQPAILGVFEDHPFLAALSEHQRMNLASGMEPFSVERGERFIHEGETANAFYLLRSGHVQVETSLGGGEVRPLQTLGPGEVVGWSWLLPPHRWQFSARALEPVQGFSIDAGWLRDLCEKDCSLGHHLCRQLIVVLTQRLSALRRQCAPSNELVHSP